jgi:Tol biopolymer transport system component
MRAPNWDRVKQIFQEALDQPANERAAFVREQCGADAALQAEVESLLATHEQAGRFGEEPAVELLRGIRSDSRIAGASRLLGVGECLGAYQIQSLVGAGGMGEVYKARDTRLDRTVAIKVLPPHLAADRDRYQRFEREARAVASLDHPHICALYDVGEHEGLRFLVMQYLEGETLAARLSKGPLPLDQAMRYAIEIADALDHAHRRAVVHRDLKPGNIVLTKSGAKLLDFGLAKWRAPDAAGVVARSSLQATVPAGVTEQGMLVGTLNYMAPEQLEGKDIDARTDLFAFGLVVYEMVTGKKAFDGASSASIIAAILSTQPAALSTVRPLTPPALDHLVATCLAKDPDQRWQAAGDVARDLRWIAQPDARTPSGVASGAAQWSRRAALFIAIAAWIAGGLVGGTAVWKRTHASAPAPVLQVTRTVETLPAGTALNVDATRSLALSPDGTRLAYVLRHTDSSQIYIRVLNEFNPRPIAGTEGGETPFFSPDGRWLGFWVQGKLKKVAVTGGAPQTICDSEEVLGATWGPDDTMVVGANFHGGLSRCDANGGRVQVVTVPDRAKHERSHRWPQFLPGGRALLFTIVPAEAASFDEARIAALSLDTGQIRALLENATNPRYAPTGHLLYVRGASLFAVPFDPGRLEVTGQSVPVIEGVMTNAEAGYPQFAVADNGLLAYAPGVVRGMDRQVVWVDRHGRMELLMDLRRAFSSVVLSPEGNRLAVTIAAPNDQVWLYDLARRTLTRLTSAGSNHVWSWTPDGKRVVVSGDWPGVSWQLYWQPVDGSSPAERLADSSEAWGGSWSPDGKLLVFTGNTNDAVHQRTDSTTRAISLLALGPPRSVRPLIQNPFPSAGPHLSPDGRWMAYVSDESGQPEVYVRPFPRVDSKRQISTNGGTFPLWASHGRELFYKNGRKLFAVPIRTEPEFIAGTPRLLFEGSFEVGVGRPYDIAPDGRFIMIQTGQSEAPVTQIALVQNWFEELKQRVPAR